MNAEPAAAALWSVSKSYGPVTALDEVTTVFEQDRIHGLFGRNGAGKTTVMRILAAHDVPTAGRAEVFGEDPYENVAALAGTCFVRESLTYPDDYRVRHALAAAAAVRPSWDAGFAEALAADFGLSGAQRCTTLSRGQHTALGLVIGLAARAPLTFFDEPHLGLDAVARQLFHERLLADYAEHPRTVLLSTHLIDEVADVVEHVVVLDRGRVAIDGEVDALRGRALTVTGPVDDVERYVGRRPELHRDSLGPHLRVTLPDADPDPREENLQFEPVSLQQFVVHSTAPHIRRTDREVLS